MNMMRSIQLFITVGISFFLSMGFIVQNVHADSKIYPDDGIWEDTFDNKLIYYFNDTVLVNGAVELIKDQTEFKNYDFNDTIVQRNHFAYGYRTFLFIPWWKTFAPATHISKENIFDVFRNESIKKNDNDYATWNASFLHSFVVQHYRFHLDSSAEIISKITVKWFGKATKNANLEIFFWNSSGGKLLKNGNWTHLMFANGDENIVATKEIKKGDIKYALDENNYIDICVVGTFFPILLKYCSLSTNYITLETTGEQGYKMGEGTITTKNPINASEISPHFKEFYWEQLTWDDYQGSGTTIRYQLLYENDSDYDPIPDRYFLNNPEGKNSLGFTQPPVYLNAVPYEKLKIRATLNNSNSPSTSPRIFNWALTWQNSSQWQDLFNTSYRVSVKNKVTIANGGINLSKIQGEWPMFGFNPENNRAITGSGPSSSIFYWGNEKEKVGGRLKNPVIGNGKVYIASKRTLNEYRMEKISTVQPLNSKHSFDFDIMNSPAVTNDYIIVATGQMAYGGQINHIYALQKDDISKPPIWDFSNDDIKICYFSSPVIAGDTLFITSWGGDNRTVSSAYQNNKILSINLKDGESIWQAELPAASYSTPAVSVSSDIVVAGCSASDNDSIFAFNLKGTKLWSKNIGTIGYASPVVYKNMVFVIAASKTTLQKETKVYALNLSDGGNLWNKTICFSGPFDDDVDDSTPAIYDDVLYVASPNGTIFAFHASDGTPLWSASVYSRPIISPQSLISSPVYADGYIYVGTPSTIGEQIKAVSIATHTVSWTFSTVDQPQGGTKCPILGSPVVSNGLLFVADESGHFYSIGKYKTPTQYINGSITSIPIKIPESYWWNRFTENTSYNKTFSQITFKLVDENNNVLKDIQNGSSLLLSTLTLPRTIRLRADFTTKNISVDNPRLLWWTINFIEDAKPPFLDSKTIYPSFGGWLNVVIPQISIKVKDNLTGLLVSSAQYTLEYILDNKSYSNTYAAYCTGTNGTTQTQNLTANLSSIPNFNNITALKSITFIIKDLAGNIGEKYVKIQQDITAPNSTVLKQYIKPQYDGTAKYIWINASVTNTGTNPSAILSVELYYRYSSTGTFSADWVYFANSTQKSSPSWKFNFTNKPNQAGGYFEVCTKATDTAGNSEELPTQGDATFIYDWKRPDPPSVSGETLWFNELPSFSVIFSDDFRLDTIQYRPNFEFIWTTIATHINSSSYDTDAAGHSWSLTQDYWNQMQQDEVYYLYFRINDTVGNTLQVEDNDQAIIIRKDISPPQVTIEVPSEETGLSWTTNFTVTGLGNDDASGIKEALLYYQYSEDNSNWSNWAPYGESLDSSPFQWEFDATEGDGYYKVKITVTDYAGNLVNSDPILIPVFSFPTTLALVMVALITVLIFLSVIIYLKWRKKESTS